MSNAVKVEPMRSDMNNSPIMDSTDGESTVMMDAANASCRWNDAEFAEGSIVECDGTRYECSFGQWVKSG